MSKLEKFLEENNIYFKVENNSIVINCPNCDKEKLYIHTNELNFICFYCSGISEPIKGPNATKLLSEITGLDYGLVKRKLSGFVSLADFANQSLFEEIKKNIIEKKEEKTIVFPEYSYRLNTAVAIPAVEYLNKRGIPLDIATKYDLRYDYKNQNLIFPVYDKDKLVGYQTRSIDPDCPKHFQKRTLKSFEKSDYLMFENSINDDRVILAEGPISALKFAKSDIGFVASMGKYVSDSQINRLKDRGIKTIYLALDEDALEETIHLMNRYDNVFDFYLLQLNDEIRNELKNIKEPDFGDCTFEQISIILQEAMPFNRNTAFMVKNR